MWLRKVGQEYCGKLGLKKFSTTVTPDISAKMVGMSDEIRNVFSVTLYGLEAVSNFCFRN